MQRAIDFEPLAFQQCSVFAGSRQIGSQLHTGETEMLTEDQFAKLINSKIEIVNNLRAEKAALATLDAKPFPKTLNRWSLGPQLEFWSSVLSIGCLAYTLYIWTRGTANVRLTQEILLYTNELQLTNAMRHLQVEYNAWCNKKFRMDLEVPTWDPKNVERNGFDVTFSNRGADAGILQGISTSIDIHYTTIDLFYVAIPIFMLSQELPGGAAREDAAEEPQELGYAVQAQCAEADGIEFLRQAAAADRSLLRGKVFFNKASLQRELRTPLSLIATR